MSLAVTSASERGGVAIGHTRGIDELEIFEADAFQRAGLNILPRAQAVLRANGTEMVSFKQGRGLARLVNLLAWRVEAYREYLDGDGIYADQVVHAAIHQVFETRLGQGHVCHALFAETLASASDLYLLGGLIGAGEETDFLVETLESFGSYYEQYAEETALETLLERVSQKPYATMIEAARYLYDFCTPFLRPFEPAAMVAQLEPKQAHAFYPLVHHYNIGNWILTLRGVDSPPSDLPSFDQLAGDMLHTEADFLKNFNPAVT